MTRPLLIVSADDFGLTPGVCAAVLRAGESGVLTSTSVLVSAPAFADHAPALRDSGLGVGLHLALVGEDPPVLSAREIPSLVDGRGRLARSWRHLVVRLVLRSVDLDDVARELGAQLAVARSAGLELTHLDAHQHLHVWPSLVPVVRELASSAGVRAVRRPRWGGGSATARGFDALSDRAARRYEAAGLVLPDDALGMDRSGRLDAAAVTASVDGLAGRPALRSAELATHPGTAVDPDRARYRWGFDWAAELDALCSPAVADAVARSGWRTGTFADLAAGAP